MVYSVSLVNEIKMSCDDDGNGEKLMTSIISCNGGQESQIQKPTSTINMPKTPVSLLQVNIECKVGKQYGALRILTILFEKTIQLPS